MLRSIRSTNTYNIRRGGISARNSSFSVPKISLMRSTRSSLPLQRFRTYSDVALETEESVAAEIDPSSQPWFKPVSNDPVALALEDEREYEQWFTKPKPLVGEVIPQNQLKRDSYASKRIASEYHTLLADTSKKYALLFWLMGDQPPVTLWALYEVYRRLDFVPSAALYKKLLTRFMTAKEVKLATKLLTDMADHGFAPDTESVQLMLSHTRGPVDVMRIFFAAGQYGEVEKLAGKLDELSKTMTAGHSAKDVLDLAVEQLSMERQIAEESVEINARFSKLTEELNESAQRKRATLALQDDVNLAEMTAEWDAWDRKQEAKFQKLKELEQAEALKNLEDVEGGAPKTEEPKEGESPAEEAKAEGSEEEAKAQS